MQKYYTKNRYISLIVCTIGREKELNELLQSLADQEYKYFELILVDQSYDDKLKKIIEIYTKSINIRYVTTDKIGLSYARNVGLKYTKGEIIGFPDDDCILFNSTLKLINDNFNIYDPDFLSIKEINAKNFSSDNKIRNDIKKISFFNFMKYCNSIRIYVKKNAIENIKFDECLGVGSKFGSAEESDFICNLLSKGKIGITVKNTFIYHPKKVTSINKSDLKRAHYYGLGMGAFFKKNLIKNKIYPLVYYFLIYFFIKPIFRMFRGIVTLNVLDFLYAYYTIRGRIIGFISFKNENSFCN